MSIPPGVPDAAESTLLRLENRSVYQTLLDAPVLNDDSGNAVIIYVQTDKPTEIISRRRFRIGALSHAIAMRGLGIKPRDGVIIAHTQNLESIYAFWGTILLGAIPSMFPTLTEKLDPEIYTQSMAQLVKHSGAKAILTTDTFATDLREHVTCAVHSSSDLRSVTASGNVTVALPSPEDIAFLQHSSGTTGLQKGVALSHQAVLNQIAAYSDAINLNADDVIVSWLPLYHDMGLIAGFLLPLIQGIPLVLMSPFDWVKHPALLLQAISDYSGTLCWLPNFAYNHMAQRVRDRDMRSIKLEKMRAFINCSEPVSHESHTMFLERFRRQGLTEEMLSVSYAMAENTFAVTQTPPGAPPTIDIIDRVELETKQKAVTVTATHPNAVKKVSCGKPIEGCSVRVLDENSSELPERSVGEMVIKSDSMLTGYHNRDDLQPLKDGWYHTGDTGYIADGEVYIVGRKKDLIINAGKNIYPQDIEAIVNDVEGVKAGRAVVFGVPDEQEGTELIAVVAEVETKDEDERKAINKTIRKQVSQRSTVSASFVKLVDDQWIIKTSSGKIARAANRDKWLKEREKPDQPKPPTSPEPPSAPEPPEPPAESES